MPYSLTQKAAIKAKAFAKLTLEFSNADSDEEIERLASKYGISIDEEPVYVNTHQMKILVFGDLAGKVNEYKKAAKRLGISADSLEFENDYSKLGNYNVAKLKNSNTYSDIIIGPNPHKQRGINGHTSFIVMLRSNPYEYPKCIEAHANNAFKITISNFKEALLNTRYIEALNQ